MSGTSLDGVDFVKIKVYKKNLKCEFIAMQSFKFPQALRHRLFLAAQNEKKVSEISNLNHDLGRFYAECFSKLKKKLRRYGFYQVQKNVFHHRPRKDGGTG